MTALELNAEFYKTMGIIANDESLMSKALKYIKKLASSKPTAENPTLMTKEEFLAKLERCEEVESNVSMNNCINDDKYCNLVLDLKIQLESQRDYIYSAIVYGSFCRHELYSVFSDIDLLCVIKGDSIDRNLAKSLQNIITNCYKKYNIKTHLRIRNLSDLQTTASGIYDCGFTSSINKLRDGILLYGSSLDLFYMNFIQQSDADDYIKNLKYRYSDLNYQNRSLISMIENVANETMYNSIVKYKCGCILFQLAELTCYTYGYHFTTATNALYKAKMLTGNAIFDDAILFKTGQIEIDLPYFVESIDKIICYNAKAINPEYIFQLKQIEISKFSELPTNMLITIRNKRKAYQSHINNDVLQFKESIVDNEGKLYVIYT